MAIENVVFARGHEGQSRSFASYRGFDDGRRFEIFLKKIVPVFQDVAMHQQHCTFDVARAAKIFRLAFAYIHQSCVHSAIRGRCPRHGDGSDREIYRRRHPHAGSAFRPRLRNAERLQFGVIGSGGLERALAPEQCFLHGIGARHAPANFVGQYAQVLLQRRRLAGFADDPLRAALRLQQG